jgi:hypothetical protein
MGRCSVRFRRSVLPVEAATRRGTSTEDAAAGRATVVGTMIARQTTSYLIARFAKAATVQEVHDLHRAVRTLKL